MSGYESPSGSPGYGPPGYVPPPGAPVPPGPWAPPPPPGPGVTPPFTAPPTDRNRRGLWLGLGIGGLVLALCCVGGIVGFVLLTVSASRQVEQQAVQVVGDYLGALQDRDYQAAYALLCPEVTNNLTEERFARQEEARPHITTYQVEKAEVSNAIVVPARVGYETGASETRRYELSQDFGQELRICGGIF
jgi:hypothetical protein